MLLACARCAQQSLQPKLNPQTNSLTSYADNKDTTLEVQLSFLILQDDCKTALTRLTERVSNLEAENGELKSKLEDRDSTIEKVSRENERLQAVIQTISNVISRTKKVDDTKDGQGKTNISQIDSNASDSLNECYWTSLFKKHNYAHFHTVKAIHQEAVYITKTYIDFMSNFPEGCNDWFKNNGDWFKDSAARPQDKLKELSLLASEAILLFESDTEARKKMGDISKSLEEFFYFLNHCQDKDYPRISSTCVSLVKDMFGAFHKFTSTATSFDVLFKFSTFLTYKVTYLKLHADPKVTDLYKMRMHDLIARKDELILKDKN